MKIGKAIELLSDSAFKGLTTHDADFKTALRMGILALNFVRQNSGRNAIFRLQEIKLEET